MPTPVRWKVLKALLSGYDEEETDYLINGFRYGFRINFHGERNNTLSPNLKSAKEHSNIIRRKLLKEAAGGRIAGPFLTPPFQNFKVSPIGVVPKKDQGEFRMIHHLSYPKHSGLSVNEQIPCEFTQVNYESLDDAIDIIKQIGTNTFMAKTDIQSAFRIIPVHPEDYCLLGFKWEEGFYYDRCLPMGAASSCQIFERFSTALKWIGQHKFGIQFIVKILDDFLFLAPSAKQATAALASFKEICSKIGVPLNNDKTFTASTTMEFLGITLDSTKMEARLPEAKLSKVKTILFSLLDKQSCSLRSLLSIVGLLNFACSVVKPGRAFLRRLIDLSIGIKKLHYHVKLKSDVKNDIRLWLEFLKDFNGKSMFINEQWLSCEAICLYTDSAGSKGYGAVYKSKWFYGKFPMCWRGANITFLELYPIVVALYTWGCRLKNHSVTFCTDNEALVAIINKQTSKLPCIMFLVRKLVLITLRCNIIFKAKHIRGKHNILADALSRFQIQQFKQLAPYCDPNPTELAHHLKPEIFCKDLKL